MLGGMTFRTNTSLPFVRLEVCHDIAVPPSAMFSNVLCRTSRRHSKRPPRASHPFIRSRSRATPPHFGDSEEYTTQGFRYRLFLVNSLYQIYATDFLSALEQHLYLPVLRRRCYESCFPFVHCVNVRRISFTASHPRSTKRDRHVKGVVLPGRNRSPNLKHITTLAISIRILHMRHDCQYHISTITPTSLSFSPTIQCDRDLLGSRTCNRFGWTTAQEVTRLTQANRTWFTNIQIAVRGFIPPQAFFRSFQTLTGIASILADSTSVNMQLLPLLLSREKVIDSRGRLGVGR